MVRLQSSASLKLLYTPTEFDMGVSSLNRAHIQLLMLLALTAGSCGQAPPDPFTPLEVCILENARDDGASEALVTKAEAIRERKVAEGHIQLGESYGGGASAGDFERYSAANEEYNNMQRYVEPYEVAECFLKE